VIDRDIHLARALLVESNPLLRSVGVGQLRDVGVGHVEQARSVKDARLLLERERFDIVICNREFEGSDFSGQDLLDELRRERLLPHSTVFLMVTAKASYHHVVEAAEAALDGFLVRPYTSAVLGSRLTEARKRKRQLGDVLRALDTGAAEVALVHAIKRFQEQQPYWLYCGRLAAELLLTLQRPADARRIFERLVAVKAGAGWARLGVARAQSALGDIGNARKTVAEVLLAEPDSADAHDMMGRILVDLCDFDAALIEYRTAAELTPGCLLRAQHAGALAMGVQSKLFDALSLLLIALLRHDRADAAGVAAMRVQLRSYGERFPDSKRLQRFEQAALVLMAMLGAKTEPALQTLRALSAQAGDDDFDLEAANVLLALWARAPEALGLAGEFEAVAERIGMRFCTSKAIGESLIASGRRSEPASGVIRSCQARVSATAEQAMDCTLKGEPAAAVRLLLAQGEQTLNAKLLEMAGVIARRHMAAIPEAQAFIDHAAAVLRRSCQTVNHIAGIQRSGRSPGGLQLRGHQPSETANAAA
jgi:CheY-like chemotaxis protein